MKILALSDWHSNKEALDGLLKKVNKLSPDMIVFCGDVVKGAVRGNTWLDALDRGEVPNRNTDEITGEMEEDIKTYHFFYRTLNKIGAPTYIVPGNMDAPEELYIKTMEEITSTSKNIKLVHNRTITRDDFVIAGFGGEVTKNLKEDYFVLQYPAHEISYSLETLNESSSDLMLIFHTPPISNLDMDNGKHKGCQTINDMINMYSPKLVFCGHAHKAQGKQKIENSLVVNPGALKDGYYAVVDTKKMEVKFDNIL